MNTTKKFNNRAFISIVMFISGSMLPVSGIINHSLQFEPLTRERHLWMSIHNMSGMLFIIFAIWHIVLNWKPLVNHINRAKSYLLTKEAITALLFVLLLVGLAALHTLHSGSAKL